MEAHFVLPRGADVRCGVPAGRRGGQTDVEGQTGKLAYVAEHTHQAARASAWGKQQTF